MMNPMMTQLTSPVEFDVQLRTLVPVSTPTPPALSEAPCSVNTFVETPSLGRVQVTGRGTTPAEAVANLQGMVETLRPTIPPVVSREERMAKLLACGLTRATAKGDWTIVEKLSKAAALVLSGAVQPTDSPLVMAVRSQKEAESWYEVTVEGLACTCKDWEHGTKTDAPKWCKHGLAVAMHLKLENGNV